jgi:hypothetical protein
VADLSSTAEAAAAGPGVCCTRLTLDFAEDTRRPGGVTAVVRGESICSVVAWAHLRRLRSDPELSVQQLHWRERSASHDRFGQSFPRFLAVGRGVVTTA